MSSFVVHRETIHIIAPLFAHDSAACEQLDKVGRDLLRLNEEATAYRYRSQPNRASSEAYRYSPRETPADIVRLKCLQCFLYQCMEGKPFEENPLYVQGREIELQLLRAVVSSLPDYNAAPWGAESRQKRRPALPVSSFGASVLRIMNSETGETIPRALLLECGIQCGAIDPPPATPTPPAPEFFDSLATFEECTPNE